MPDDSSNSPDPVEEHARIEALARVRTLLLDLGCTNQEVDLAVEDDVIDLLVVDRMLVPTGRRLTQAEVASSTQISLDVAKRFWRALGFLDVGEADRSFTEMDIEAIQIFQSMVAMGLVDLDSAVQMARVIGSSMARIAEAEAAPGSTPILMGTGDSILDADQFAKQAGTSIPAMGRLLEYVWRRHLQAATRRAMLHRTRGPEEGLRPVMAVGFADMVGFTMLSQHLGDDELASVVARFEELAHDTVVALGGRVVKMIGDEVMFVVPTANGAAQIGISLAEAYASDDLLSDVRVALAVGPVLVKDGDFYGPVVNLASRLVNVAHPGTVLISDEFREALLAEGATDIDTRPLRTRNLKDLGRVQMWKLLRAGTEPGSDSRRTMRWERLGEVLRELDELRERGEQDRPGGSGTGTGSPVDGSGVEPGSGDAVGTQVEGSLEGGDRTAS